MAHSLASMQLGHLHHQFVQFLEKLDCVHETYKFWHGFLCEDSLAYLWMYTALRYRDWDLRQASDKQMGALYTAYDHGAYQRLIPQHLWDLCSLPESILAQLKVGAFGARLKSTEWNDTAIDECHEMAIHKDCKLAIIRPTKEQMTFIANHLPFLAVCQHNLKNQVLPPKKRKTCYQPTARGKAIEGNAKATPASLNLHGWVPTDQGKTLCTITHHKMATPEQSHDLMTFRAEGPEGCESYVKTRLLGEPSTQAPVLEKEADNIHRNQISKTTDQTGREGEEDLPAIVEVPVGLGSRAQAHSHP